MSSEVEETLKRLVSHTGVLGTIIVNSDGVVRLFILNIYSLVIKTFTKDLSNIDICEPISTSLQKNLTPLRA